MIEVSSDTLTTEQKSSIEQYLLAQSDPETELNKTLATMISRGLVQLAGFRFDHIHIGNDDNNDPILAPPNVTPSTFFDQYAMMFPYTPTEILLYYLLAIFYCYNKGFVENIHECDIMITYE